MLPHIDFHLFGDLKTLGNMKGYQFNSNIRFFDYIDYNKILKILSNYELALMPFQTKIRARQKIRNIKYISPLKMFDYLAAGKVIIATKLKAYEHILKNNDNSFLLSSKDFNKWKLLINNVLKIQTNLKVLNLRKKYCKKIFLSNRALKFVNFVEDKSN